MEQHTKAPCCTRLQQSVELHARLHAACRTYRVLKKGEWVAGTTVLLFFLLAGGGVGGRLGLLLSQLLAQAIQLASRHQDDSDPGLISHIHHSVCQALSGEMVGVLSRPFRCSVSHRARSGDPGWRSDLEEPRDSRKVYDKSMSSHYGNFQVPKRLAWLNL